jgi:hypothetical protein
MNTPSCSQTDRSRFRSLCEEQPAQTSSELAPEELRSMLSELSGTPLREANPRSPWDTEASARLRQFQGSESLPATGMPDDVTVERLRVRYEHVLAQRTEMPQASPSSAGHARVLHSLQSVLHTAEHIAKELAHDAPLRAQYMKDVSEFSADIMQRFERGMISEGEAAYMASSFRNQAMNTTRGGLSPAGKMISAFLKAEGKTLPQLVQQYALSMFKKSSAALTPAESGQVCLKIAQRSGVTNDIINVGSRFAPAAGKALMAVGIALAFYQVATADDTVGEAIKQGAGFAGGVLGAKFGAVIGLPLCGPFCAFAGAIAGGIVGAMAAEEVADFGYQKIKG